MKEAGRRIREDIKNFGRGMGLAVAYVLGGLFLGISPCPMVLLTGFPCPGCGMSRAAVLFLKGHWKEAWQMHPFIYIVLILAVLAFIQRYIWGRSLSAIGRAAVLTALLAIGFYIYRIVKFFPCQAPMTYEAHNAARIFYNLMVH